MIDAGRSRNQEAPENIETGSGDTAGESVPLYIPGVSLDADVSGIEKQMYRNPYTRKYVQDFYTGIAGSAEFARLILSYSDKYDLPYSFVFSLVWNESRFNYRAVNHNPGSIDRGLFQLNSLSFPELNEKEFFRPEINISQGTKYLRWCLDTGGNDIVGLAIYNAGRTKVERNGTPRKTLDYISGILDYRKEIEKKFKDKLEKSLERNEIAYLIN